MLGVSGVEVSFHYCGGTLKHFGLQKDDDDKGCCGKKSKGKCCKDKVVKIDRNDHHHSIVKQLVPKTYFSEQIVNQFWDAFYNAPKEYKALTSIELRPPPLHITGPPLYVLHSVFRI
jgi:hypothetical protein